MRGLLATAIGWPRTRQSEVHVQKGLAGGWQTEKPIQQLSACAQVQPDKRGKAGAQGQAQATREEAKEEKEACSGARPAAILSVPDAKASQCDRWGRLGMICIWDQRGRSGVSGDRW